MNDSFFIHLWQIEIRDCLNSSLPQTDQLEAGYAGAGEGGQ